MWRLAFVLPPNSSPHILVTMPCCGSSSSASRSATSSAASAPPAGGVSAAAPSAPPPSCSLTDSVTAAPDAGVDSLSAAPPGASWLRVLAGSFPSVTPPPPKPPEACWSAGAGVSAAEPPEALEAEARPGDGDGAAASSAEPSLLALPAESLQMQSCSPFHFKCPSNCAYPGLQGTRLHCISKGASLRRSALEAS